jgi:hypothetical protein
MLSAYGETPWQYREIVDPYLGYGKRAILQAIADCNLMTLLFPSPYSSEQNPRSNPCLVRVTQRGNCRNLRTRLSFNLGLEFGMQQEGTDFE